MFIAPEWKDVQEFLRFRADDPRDKFLYLSAEYDYNGALDPEKIAHVLSRLSVKFDLKYQVVKDYQDICSLVETAAKTGKLTYLIIDGHGSPSSIALDKLDSNNFNGISSNMNFSSCFSGIHPNGKVILFSCLTGGKEEGSDNPFNNIAQKIADIAKRVVIAPKDEISSYYTEFLSEDDMTFYHPEKKSNRNLFQAFRPRFKNCFPEIDIEKLPTRELDAMEAIKEELVNKSLLHQEVSFTKQYLQNCADDPKDKVLFFSAAYDKNTALTPKFSVKVLSIFADLFDFRYKMITSFNEICDEVNTATKLGNVKAVIVDAHGTPKNGMVLSKDENGNEQRLDLSKDFEKCFSKIHETATIALLGGSLAQNGRSENNIPQRIANILQKVVIAPTCPVYGVSTSLESTDPIMFKHPPHPLMNRIKFGCWENNPNLFKKFKPNQPKRSKDRKEL